MARARNIKPGFFVNEDLVELDFATRLLFAGLWTLADREGRLEDRPKKIKIGVFPADNVDVDQMLQELHDAKFIVRYEVNGVGYVKIQNWHKHQNPHHTEKQSEIPDINGETTVKERKKVINKDVDQPDTNGESTVKAEECNGGNLADSLIPDSLIPDSSSSLRSEEGRVAKSPAPSPSGRQKREETTLGKYLADCREKGVKPVPDDHSVRTWAQDAGISDEMLQVAWVVFRERYTEDSQYKAKRYKDWVGTFANSVKDRWFSLWFTGEGGVVSWSSTGMQRKQVLDARAAKRKEDEQRKEQEAAHAIA